MDFFLLCLFTLLVFMRPTDYIPWLMGSNILDIVAGLCLFVLLLRFDRLYHGPHNIFLFGFLLAGILSHVAYDVNVEGIISTFFIFLKLAVVYLLVANVINSPQRLTQYFIFLSGLLLVVGLNALWQVDHRISYFGGVKPLIQVLRDPKDIVPPIKTLRIRGIGIFEDPNDLGQILVLGGMLSLGVLLTSRSVLSRIYQVLAISVFALAIYHTNSRGTILALIAGLGYYVVRSGRRLLPKLVGASLLFLVLTLGPSRTEFMTTASSKDRLELWSTAINLFKEHPIIGVGVGRFSDAADIGKTAHQSYLLVLSEMGLVGYYFWLGLIFLFFFTIHTIRKKLLPETEEERNVLLLFNIVEAGVFGYLIAAYFLSRSYQFPLFLLLGLSPAMILIVRNFNPDFKFSLHQKDWLLLSECVLGTAFFLYLLTRILWNLA